MERRVILLNAAFYLCVSWVVIFVLLGFCKLKSAKFCVYFPTLEGTFMNYMFVLTTFNIIIGCILFFSYLPHYKSGIRDDKTIKSMHQVIQAWRGLSTVSVILYGLYLIHSFQSTYTKKSIGYFIRFSEFILFGILVAICGLSYAADYSVGPTTTPSVFPMALPANPLLAPLNTFPMARTHPTATPTF